MYGGLHSPHSLDPALLGLAREFTPRVEVRGSALLLDLRGLGRLWPDPCALGQSLFHKAEECTPSVRVALAWARDVALLVARAREGLTIVPAGQEAAALAPLPLSLLDLSPEHEELLRAWGLRTLGQLAELPPVGLAERLGPQGPRLIRLARGEDETPLVPTPPPEAFECSLELDWPVEGLEPLAFLLSRILESLCGALEKRGQRASALTLELDLVDGTRNERTQKTVTPTGEPRTWRTLLLLDIEANPPGDAIRRMTLRAEPTPSRPVQFSLLDPAQPSPERLAEMLGRLQRWVQAGRGGSPALIDSHRPGAFLLKSFSPPACRPDPPKSSPRVALRAFRPPVGVCVVLQEGAPVFLSGASVRGKVLERAGPWKASGDWWDEAWSREEWDVALAGGGLYRIFRDLIRDQWFIEGELD
jgi:protein ImuB